MDSSTVHAIGDLAVDAQKANRIEADVPAVILRSENGGQKISSLEHLQPGRSRYRGTFSTISLLAFAEHVLAVSGKALLGQNIAKAQTFIDADKVSATTFFNLGTFDHPGHADHKAVLTLKPSAAYAALQTVTREGYSMNQRQLHDFLEDWRDIVTPVYGDEEDPKRLPSALAAVRSITIEQARSVNLAESDFGAKKSAMESIDAKSDHVLPARFAFRMTPYEGFAERKVYLRLGVMSGGNDALRLVLRLQQVERVQEEITAEFRNLLDAQIREASELFIGTFAP